MEYDMPRRVTNWSKAGNGAFYVVRDDSFVMQQ
jgi:hypothetical protein